jgi:hypothetical protein
MLEVPKPNNDDITFYILFRNNTFFIQCLYSNYDLEVDNVVIFVILV